MNTQKIANSVFIKKSPKKFYNPSLTSLESDLLILLKPEGITTQQLRDIMRPIRSEDKQECHRKQQRAFWGIATQGSLPPLIDELSEPSKETNNTKSVPHWKDQFGTCTKPTKSLDSLGTLQQTYEQVCDGYKKFFEKRGMRPQPVNTHYVEQQANIQKYNENMHI